jgi:threonine dehydrogenase-like Zn-dependent dehydrogenase
MRAVETVAVGEVAVTDIPDPRIVASDDAVLRVTHAAICGSDLHQIADAGNVVPGFAMGHEFMGVVVEAGPDAAVAVGERYVSSMFVPCGRCEDCVRGRANRCPYMGCFGAAQGVGGETTPLPGGQADYVRVPRAGVGLVRVPDGVDDEDALFVGDILSTAFTVVDSCGVQPGDDVVVVGYGPVGQLVSLVAPLFGAARVFAVDTVAERLALADSFGAIAVDGADEPAARILDATGGRGAARAIDAVGVPAATATAVEALATGGTARFVMANPAHRFEIAPFDLFRRQASIGAVLGDPYRWRGPALAAVAAGRLAPSRIVSTRLPLEDAVEGYARFAARAANKVVLTPAAR